MAVLSVVTECASVTWSEAGRFDLRVADCAFRGCSAAVCLEGQALLLSRDARLIESSSAPSKPDGPLLRTVWQLGASFHLVYTVHLDASRPMLSMRVELVNHGPAVKVRSLRPLVIAEPDCAFADTLPEQWVLFRDGRTKNALPAIYRFGCDRARREEAVIPSVEDGELEPSLVPAHEPLQFRSEHLLAMRRRDRTEAILFGFTTLGDMFCQVQVLTDDAERRFLGLEAICQCDGYVLEHGQSMRSEDLLIDGSLDSLGAIEHWAERVASENRARRAGTVPAGWCSWYFYFADIREEDVIENIDFIASQGLSLAYVQIDEGWNNRHGDWEANEKFPHGMKWLAGEIRERGLRPGIWIAPFLAHPESRIAREHPDWLLRDASGKLIEPRSSMEPPILDPTVPGVQDYLRQLGRRLVHEWGFEYVKADFIRGVSLLTTGRYHGNATRAQAVRMGLEALRDGMGEEALLLACGGQYGPTLGIVNGNRTGADTLPDWSTFIWGARQSISRWYMNRRWWFNDSDNLCVRDNTEPFRSIPRSTGKFTEAEVETATTLLYLSGGLAMVGERLPMLSEKRLALIDLVTPPLGQAARPRDLFEEPIPTILDVEVAAPHGTWHTVGVVNWGDAPRQRTVRLSDLVDSRDVGGRQDASVSRYHVYEFWSRRYYGQLCSDAKIDLGEIPPHGCRLIMIKKVEGVPQLISTNAHLSQGAVEIEAWEADRDHVSVTTRNLRMPARLLLWFPEDWQPKGLALDGDRLASIELPTSGRSVAIQRA